ncbi:MAG: hypothetical protein ABIT37_06285 [Luteolibacter sp.]
MTSSFLGIGFLVTIPILIAQWIGILGLGKRDRSPAWKCMLAGICCNSLGAVGTIVFSVNMMLGSFSSISGSGFSSSMVGLVALSSLSGLGSLLFFIGFAMHGQKGSASQIRIGELEAIAATQGEELNRLRAAQGGVS